MSGKDIALIASNLALGKLCKDPKLKKTIEIIESEYGIPIVPKPQENPPALINTSKRLSRRERRQLERKKK